MELRPKDETEIRIEDEGPDRHLERGVRLLHALRRAAEREAVLVVREAAPQAAHANLARVLEAGEADGLPFVLVEDLRATVTIAELLATRGAPHWQEAVELARHLARALAVVHEAGL